jgi:hypothetical protein
MNQLATQQQTTAPAKRERIDVMDAVPLLDTGRFEHMQRVATVMARSTLMPESLYMEGKRDEKTMLPYEQILSNCFLVVNQAVRWGLDPFAVAQCVSVVHGKLCYEGKLVSAVLQAKMGMSLHHHFIGEGEAMRIYLSDKPLTEEVVKLLKPGYRRQDMRIFDGSVAEWKTTGAGTPWTAKNFPRMLIYRGTRDWCRIYEPALMLGVYTDDEMVDMEESSRFRNARNVTPQQIIDPFSDDPIPALQSPKDEQEQSSAVTHDGEAFDASTGELMEQTQDTGSPPSSEPGADEQSPATSAEADETPSSSASSSSDADREILMRYAKDVLPLAGNPETSGATLSAIEKGYAGDEFTRLTPEGKEKAKAISRSMRAIFNNETSLDIAIGFYAEVFDCSVEELGGANG